MKLHQVTALLVLKSTTDRDPIYSCDIDKNKKPLFTAFGL